MSSKKVPRMGLALLAVATGPAWAQTGDGSSSSLSPWVLVGVATLLLAALVIFGRRERSGSEPAAEVAEPEPPLEPAPAAAVSEEPVVEVAADAGARMTLAVAESSGVLTEQSFELTESGLSIGRDTAANQVAWDDERLSRQHARLDLKHDDVVLTNLSPVGQTFLNDEPIKEATVTIGGRIRIGVVTFVLKD